MDIYGPDFIDKYTGERHGLNTNLPPHLFAIAEDARRHMQENGTGQTIIVSGDSGAGKTESAKLIMRFLASRKGSRDVHVDEAGTVESRMLATNPILEAFGNAKTMHNDNSSRFGKYLQVNILIFYDDHRKGG
jgi:myosin-5